MFVPQFRHVLRECDPDRPWVIVGDIQYLVVELEDRSAFRAWAAERWPAPRYVAELEPESLGPWKGAG
jgi:hypothetical protein